VFVFAMPWKFRLLLMLGVTAVVLIMLITQGIKTEVRQA
jgi:hypothetical protein